MNTFKKLNRHLFSLLFILIAALNQSSKAQDVNPSIIKVSSVTYSELSDPQMAIYDQLYANESFENMYIVEIGELNTEFYESGEIKIILPFLSYDTLTYEANFVNYDGERNYSWGGNIKAPYFPTDTITDTITNFCLSGSLTLVCIEERKYGSLSAGNDRFLITDLGDGLQVMISQVPLSANALECPNAELAPEPSTYTSSTDPCVAHVLRTLVFYSDAASATGLDPAAIAQTGIVQLNSTGGNSGIGDLNGIIVGVQNYSGFTENSTQPLQDVTDFANDSYIISERASYNADICILLTHGNYTIGGSGVAGIVRKIGPEFDSAFAIIEINYATDAAYFSMTHEIGHLFGARHDLNHTNGDNNDYGHGMTFEGCYHFLQGHDYYRTMMGYPNCGPGRAYPSAYNENSSGVEPRIQYFSNPNIDYAGSYATGSNPYENNYLKIMNTRDRVKDFYTESLGGVQMTVTKMPFTTCDDVIEASAAITCGGAVSNSYQWYLSFNGISYTPLLGETSTTVSYGIDPINPPNLYWLKCVVTNIYGTASDVAFYFRHPCGHMPRLANMVNDQNQTSILSILTLPNPADNSLQLNIETTGEIIVNYEIFNMFGVKVRNSKREDLHEGMNNAILDIKQLAAGSYFIKMNDSRCSYTVPFIIIH